MTPTIPTISIKGIFLDTPLPLGHLGHDHYCVTASLSLKATTPSSEPRILRLILVLPDSKQIDTIVELRTKRRLKVTSFPESFCGMGASALGSYKLAK